MISQVRETLNSVEKVKGEITFVFKNIHLNSLFMLKKMYAISKNSCPSPKTHFVRLKSGSNVSFFRIEYGSLLCTNALNASAAACDCGNTWELRNRKHNNMCAGFLTAK